MFNNLLIMNLSCLAVAGTATLVSLVACDEGFWRQQQNMQNKPNLQNDEMNVTPLLTNYYENLRLYRCCKNKPNQTQFWLCNSV